MLSNLPVVTRVLLLVFLIHGYQTTPALTYDYDYDSPCWDDHLLYLAGVFSLAHLKQRHLLCVTIAVPGGVWVCC